MSGAKIFREGLLKNNPVLVQLLGMCSTMAITTSLFNGVGMGLSVTAILVCCNVCISLVRKFTPNNIRIAIYVVIIAGFVTVVDLMLQAFVPALSESLGVFIPLIVVNCIIIGRAEAFASKHSVGESFLDGLGQGLGYTAVLILMSVFREFVGGGTFGAGLLNGGTGWRLFPEEYGCTFMILPMGGFLTLGCLIALVQHLRARAQERADTQVARTQEVEG